MGLVAEFQSFLQHKLGIDAQDKVVLAVSGGRDSMLMADLFRRLSFDCVLAHCNFQLRGEASDLDEALVRAYAVEHQMPIYVKHFDTEAYAEEEHISIQMAARDLRYAWFESLRVETEADWIAVAQHKNDHIETVLLNLSRGTGLLGLQGILPKREKIIRPILFLTSAQVTSATQELGIRYRDDQTNFSTKYARNQIRLAVVPELKKVNPDFEAVMERNIQHFQEAQALLSFFIDPLRDKIFKTAEDVGIKIQKSDLQAYIGNMPLMYELFRPFGFSKEVLSDLIACWAGESGRLFASDSYELLLDRAFLYVRPLGEAATDSLLRVEEGAEAWSFGGKEFKASLSADIGIQRKSMLAQLDADLLVYPLQMRYWQEGDTFIPLGMKGRKKLSDFFIEQKLSVFEKKQVPILVNGDGAIVWIVPYRLDNRFKISERTKKVLTLDVK